MIVSMYQDMAHLIGRYVDGQDNEKDLNKHFQHQSCIVKVEQFKVIN